MGEIGARVQRTVSTQTAAQRTGMDKKLRILLIGPLPPPLGGTTVPFQQLVNEMQKRDDVKVFVIDTSRKKHGFTWRDTVRVALRIIPLILRRVRDADVISLHASSGGALVLGALVHVASRLARKPWILRLFGGSVQAHMERRSRLARWFLRKAVFSADLCLCETHRLVQALRSQCRHSVQWYANSRPMSDETLSSLSQAQCNRFVFVGHVRPSKGIREVIAAAEQLPDDVTVDVYGPLLDGMKASDFAGLRVVRYLGELPASEVIPALRTYDVFLMPTHHEGEGYPGVILEAYAAGLPVIATRKGGIPELVDETSGVLIDACNTRELLSAMQKFRSGRGFRERLREGVLEKRKLFSSAIWTERFVEHCQSVLGIR